MRYRLIERLGAGGMAEVWRGFDAVLDRQVAVKFGPGLRAEAVAEARFSHPNIVNVFDYGEWGDGRPFLVMEFIDGETLSTVLNGGLSLPWRRAVSITAQIASGLAAAHAVGIVHRDVSTGNVMLTPTGARLVDFGISAPVGEPEPPRESGDLQGTPAFMAPERLHGAEITPAADVYALGVLFYRALTGRMPWEVQSRADLLEAHLWLDPAPLPEIPGLPEQAKRLCLRCLAKDPADRPSAAQMAASLAPLARGEPIVPAVDIAPRRPRPDRAAAHEETAVILPPSRLRPTETRRMPPSRLARFAGAMLLLAGIATLGLVTQGLPGPQRPGAWSPAGPDPTPCRVTYAQQPGTGNTFSAVVTVHNDGVKPVAPWQVEFSWPGDQTLLGAQGARASQQGRQVTLRPKSGEEKLGPGAAVEFGVNGRYDQANALPSRFTLAGSACETVIVSPPPAQGGVDAIGPPAQLANPPAGGAAAGGAAGTGTAPGGAAGGGAAGGGASGGGAAQQGNKNSEHGGHGKHGKRAKHGDGG
jgi:serine/threonine-protein kinase